MTARLSLRPRDLGTSWRHQCAWCPFCVRGWRPSFAHNLCSVQASFLRSANPPLQRDFDGNVVLGVVSLHVPAVLVSELLKDLVELCLVSKKTGTRRERLPSGA